MHLSSTERPKLGHDSAVALVSPEAESMTSWTFGRGRTAALCVSQALAVSLVGRGFYKAIASMANTRVAGEFSEVSQLAKYPFEPYWPAAKLKICVTGAGGFIASHLARRLKSEGHYIVACDWKRNEHMQVLLRHASSASVRRISGGRITTICVYVARAD